MTQIATESRLTVTQKALASTGRKRENRENLQMRLCADLRDKLKTDFSVNENFLQGFQYKTCFSYFTQLGLFILPFFMLIN